MRVNHPDGDLKLVTSDRALLISAVTTRKYGFVKCGTRFTGSVSIRRLPNLHFGTF